MPIRQVLGRVGVAMTPRSGVVSGAAATHPRAQPAGLRTNRFCGGSPR